MNIFKRSKKQEPVVHKPSEFRSPRIGTRFKWEDLGILNNGEPEDLVPGCESPVMTVTMARTYPSQFPTVSPDGRVIETYIELTMSVEKLGVGWLRTMSDGVQNLFRHAELPMEGKFVTYYSPNGRVFINFVDKDWDGPTEEEASEL